MSGSAKTRKLLEWAASTQCAVILFLAIATIAIPGTFMEDRRIYASPPFLILLGMFALNLVLCTLKRRKSISKSVIVLHCGVLLTLAGCIATSFGYVATINVYEDTRANRFYRWDRNEDVDLGFELMVRKINTEYYPTPVKVGVLKNDQKDNLYTLKTGDNFEHGGYRITAETLDPATEHLKLSVYQQNRKIGTFDTSGLSDLPPGFPYKFVLVAFQNPRLKRLWLDIEIFRNSEKIAGGTSEINGPFQWSGHYFYNTQTAKDPAGQQYAGIQIVRDPGRPIVFAGFAVMAAGSVLSFTRRFSRKA